MSGTLAKPDSRTFDIVWIVFQISSVVYLPWACNPREGFCFVLVSDRPLMCKKRAVSDSTICSWNIWSLLEISGDIRISQRDGPPSSSIVDRKLDLLVGELERYGISVAGVQETKWFGSHVWPAVDGHTYHVAFRKISTTGWSHCSQKGRCRDCFESQSCS